MDTGVEMRITVCVPSLEREFGGPAVKAKSLTEALTQLGHDATVVACGSSQGDSVPVLARFHGTTIPSTLAPIREAVRQADVVHIIGFRDPVGTSAGFMARRRGVPYALEPAGMHRRRLRSIKIKGMFDLVIGKSIWEGAARVIATSHMEARELVEDGINASRIVVRPNGIDVGDLLPLPKSGAFRQRFGIPAGTPLALFIGRIAAKKGLLDLMRAISNIHAACVIVGPDDGDGTLAALRRSIQDLNIADRVIVRPHGLWGREKAQAFADSDFFCLPSATENFGTAAAEAAACGIPVILSNECGVTEFLDPEASLTVPFGDVDALTDAMRHVVRNKGMRQAAARSANRIVDRLDWRRLGKEQLTIYEACLN